MKNACMFSVFVQIGTNFFTYIRRPHPPRVFSVFHTYLQIRAYTSYGPRSCWEGLCIRSDMRRLMLKAMVCGTKRRSHSGALLPRVPMMFHFLPGLLSC